MRRSPLALVPLLVVLAAAPAASAADSTGTTSPSYPGNTLKIEAPDAVVGGSIVPGVTLSGVATWNENPTTDTTTPYAFSLYVQDPSVDPSCSPTYGEQLQKSINVNPNGTNGGSGFVLQDGLQIAPPAPANVATHSAVTPPFVVKATLKRVLLCAYQRYVTDAVATASVSIPVERASCRLRAGSVRRGSALRVRCNVKGALQVRLTRAGKTRTLKGTVPSSGRKNLSSRSLAKGLYSARFTIAGQPVGSQKLRIR
ncbi:hypothetical protein AB0L40_26630 [Patulibacter sp. NPDC049589]|uniref:hypothetical protein n=1 Tax=Patulibacter sp. NPDC049589 TaxID=3154731 RepID=UPI00341ACA49